MIRRLIPFILALFCIARGSSQEMSATLAPNRELNRHGLSVQLAFELTTPSGSRGRWNSGGGATLTTTYIWHAARRWFISPGIGAFYNSMGTDFIPEYGNLYEGTIKNFGVRIPVYAGHDIKLPGDFKLALATGPTLNVNIYAKEHANPNFRADIIEPADPVNLFGRGFNRVDLQWSFFAGLTYKEHYCVGISSGVGLTNVATITDNHQTLHIHRNNAAIMIIYKF